MRRLKCPPPGSADMVFPYFWLGRAMHSPSKERHPKESHPAYGRVLAFSAPPMADTVHSKEVTLEEQIVRIQRSVSEQAGVNCVSTRSLPQFLATVGAATLSHFFSSEWGRACHCMLSTPSLHLLFTAPADTRVTHSEMSFSRSADFNLFSSNGVLRRH